MKVKFWFEHGYNESEVEEVEFPDGTEMKTIEQTYDSWFYDQCSMWGVEGGFDIIED